MSNNDYVEVSEKETVKSSEESFAAGDVAKGDFIFVKLAGKRSIYHYIAEAVNDFYGYEYEMR
jgi:hypothetical protein